MKRPRLSLTPFRRLQWRLTFSYTLVTVGALVAVELLLFLALLLFINSDFLVNTMVQAIRDTFVPQTRAYLESTPPDLTGLNQWLQRLTGGSSLASAEQSNVRLTRGLSFEFNEAQQFIVLDANLRLLAQSPPADPAALGQSFDAGQVPGLAGLLPVALAGEDSLERLHTLLPDGRLVLALPVEEEEGRVLGVMIVVTLLPPLNLSILRPVILLVLYSVIPFTLAAGVIGTLFGFLTARGLSRRLHALSQTADAWSQGDFSAVAADRSGDEVGQLAGHLNRMAEQLQNLLQTRQGLATLEERNRLARELHDSVKQQVFATVMQVGAARALLPADPEAAQRHLAEAEQLARQAQQELTGLIQELRPAALEDRGLSEALRTYLADWSRRTGVAAQVRLQGERPLPLEVEQALFRVAQEALANVTRHSGAGAADVHLAWEAGDAVLTVADDGVGFDPAEAEQRSFGLRTMRERVESLGGRLDIDSAPGQGTRITARLKAEAPHDE
ncbi:MAG: sensor histidine kinase [Chloroflexi bacterium]|nr:sensor histidine kinase [Chloroflexota bacterium]MCI0644356.1 sensor histidine kinase [Chloroflexota bacterium]MCI0728027.1 sensor histidine kinase [Chloroflexota bacterium]